MRYSRLTDIATTPPVGVVAQFSGDQVARTTLLVNPDIRNCGMGQFAVGAYEPGGDQDELRVDES
jgi:hypothetical protein